MATKHFTNGHISSHTRVLEVSLCTDNAVCFYKESMIVSVSWIYVNVLLSVAIGALILYHVSFTENTQNF